MSKKVIRAYNFRTRTASHSLTGYAKGYSDTMPHTADKIIPSENSTLEQRKIIRTKIMALVEKKKNHRLSRREKQQFISLKSVVSNYNKTLLIESYDTREELQAWVFWRVCQHRLKHDVFRNLDMEAEAIIEANANFNFDEEVDD